MPSLFKCAQCGSYTLRDTSCPKCNGKVFDPEPPKFSLVDKYAEYRRRARKMGRSATGMNQST
ncbi:MAG: nucleolar RNA-binding Nop10p family protein [Candidatus Thorarchaeota archaeon]